MNIDMQVGFNLKKLSGQNIDLIAMLFNVLNLANPRRSTRATARPSVRRRRPTTSSARLCCATATSRACGSVRDAPPRPRSEDCPCPSCPQNASGNPACDAAPGPFGLGALPACSSDGDPPPKLRSRRPVR